MYGKKCVGHYVQKRMMSDGRHKYREEGKNLFIIYNGLKEMFHHRYHVKNDRGGMSGG